MGRRWRLLQKWERGRNGGCFKHGGGQLVVGIATCGGASGGEAGWWLERRGEREWEKNCKNRGRGVGFWPILDPIFSSLMPWNAALFIGGGRGTFCLQWCQIVAFGLVGKHPNRWFKMCTSNCQIWQSKAARVAYFRPVTGAIFTFIGLNR